MFLVNTALNIINTHLTAALLDNDMLKLVDTFLIVSVSINKYRIFYLGFV